MQNLPEFALQLSKSKWYDFLQIIVGTALNWIAQHTELMPYSNSELFDT